jgi:hypothetical protein
MTFGTPTMRNQSTRIRRLLAGVTAMAVTAITVAAPSSATPRCLVLRLGAGQCLIPGTAQINDLPPLRFQPQYPYCGNPGSLPHGPRC